VIGLLEKTDGTFSVMTDAFVQMVSKIIPGLAIFKS
jgi:hypothetical protein